MPEGTATGLVHLLPVQLRFADTDRFGHINNANYATFVESARIAFLTSVGHPLGSMILARLAIDFRRQLQMSDALLVLSRVERLGNASIGLRQLLVRPSQPLTAFGAGGSYSLGDLPSTELVAEASSVVVTFDYAANRSTPMTDALRKALAPYIGPFPGQGDDDENRA